MNIIAKGEKTTATCKCCDDYKMNAQFYKWYSPFDGNLLYDRICRKCAKRELGSKNKKAHEKLL